LRHGQPTLQIPGQRLVLAAARSPVARYTGTTGSDIRSALGPDTDPSLR